VHESKSLNGSDHRPLTFILKLFEIDRQQTARWNLNAFARNSDLKLVYHLNLTETAPIVIDALTQAQINCMQTRLYAETLPHQSRSEIIDSAWEVFVQWVNLALEDSCGKQGAFRYHEGNFWTPELRRQSQLMDELIQYLHNPNADTEATLDQKRELFKRYNNNRKKRHNELQRAFLDQLTAKPQRGAFFKYVRRKRMTRRTDTGLDAEDMNSHVSHFQSTFGSLPSGLASEWDADILEATNPRSERLLDTAYMFTEDQVRGAIKSMGVGKAPGEDGLPAEVFILGGECMVVCLTLLLNLFSMIQVMPSQWNNALVCLIYKQKGSAKEVKNYRPISLTIVAKRVYEKLIDSQLEETKKLLSPFQGGFRKGRSTLHQVYYLAELMQTQKQEKKDIHNVFLDLRAAYDTVDRRILWTRMVTHFGLSISQVRTIRALYEDTRSFLLVGGQISPAIPNTRGLPQGSSLSPTLFNFFIDQLIRQLEDSQEQCIIETPHGTLKSNSLFFADDGNLHAGSLAGMQALLTICHDWSQQVGMQFAPEKCLIVSDAVGELKLGGDLLPQVDSAMYLGIPFTARGPDWDALVEKRAQAAKGAIVQLPKIGFNAYTWPGSAKIDIYKLFVRPIMEYGVALSKLSANSMRKLENTQLLALRVAFGMPWNVSQMALRRLTCVESMNCRMKLLNANFVRSLQANNDNQVPAVQLFHLARRVRGTLARSWLLQNNAVQLDHKELQYQDILDFHQKARRIGSSIHVHRSLKHSAILHWKGESDAKHKSELIRWRLGRIAFHQRCASCRGVLSRRHAVSCTGIEDQLMAKYPEVTFEPDEATFIDTLLNTYFFSDDDSLWECLYQCVIDIKRVCLLAIPQHDR
jgi:retron-type reverse transcriptase